MKTIRQIQEEITESVGVDFDENIRMVSIQLAFLMVKEYAEDLLDEVQEIVFDSLANPQQIIKITQKFKELKQSIQ